MKLHLFPFTTLLTYYTVAQEYVNSFDIKKTPCSELNKRNIFGYAPFHDACHEGREYIKCIKNYYHATIEPDDPHINFSSLHQDLQYLVDLICRLVANRHTNENEGACDQEEHKVNELDSKAKSNTPQNIEDSRTGSNNQMKVCINNMCKDFPVSLDVDEDHHHVKDAEELSQNLQTRPKDFDDTVVNIKDWKDLKHDETIRPHTDWVRDIKSYSIEGRNYLATSSLDGKIKIIRLEDRSVIATLTAPKTSWVQSLSSYGYSLTLYKKRTEDGELIQCLASTLNGSVSLWDLHTNKLITSLDISDSAFSLVYFVRSDKSFLACGYQNGDIIIWDLESYFIVQRLKGHLGLVNALDVMETKSGKLLIISAGQDKRIRLWCTETYQLIRAMNGAHENEIWSLKWISQTTTTTSYIVSGDRGGVIKIWNADDDDDYSLVSTLNNGHTRTVYSLNVCESNGTLILVSTSSDKSVKIWNLSQQSLLRVFQFGNSVMSLDLAVNRKKEEAFVIVGDAKGHIIFLKNRMLP